MSDVSRLFAFASRWFDRTTVTGVFEPMLADWQREWLDATPVGRRVIVLRGYAAFVVTVIALLPRVAVAPIPASLARRIAIRVGLFCGFAMVAQTLPYFWNPLPSLRGPGASWLYLVPGLLIMVLPFAVIPGVDAIRCVTDLPDHLQRRAAIKLVFAATLLVVLIGGWLMPAANQRWRQTVFAANSPFQGLVPRGARELSTVELFSTTDAEFPLIRPGERVREINIRFSLTVLPLLLAWMRWRMLEQGSTRWGTRLPASVTAVTMFVFFFMLVAFDRLVEDRFAVGPGSGLWSALVLCGLAGLAEQRWRRPRRV